MTEQAQLESGQERQEAPSKPKPAVPSVASGEQQTSAANVGVDDLVQVLVPRLTPALAEALRPEWQRDDQSVKDKRIAGLESDVGALKRQLVAMGVDPKVVDQADREARVDMLLSGQGAVQGRTQPGPQATDNTASTEAAFEAISTELLSAAGIAADDEQYNAFVSEWEGKITNPEHWRTVLRAHIDRRSTQTNRQSGVTESAVVAPAGVSTPSSDDVDALTDELLKLQNPGPNEPGLSDPANIQRRKEIREQLKALTPQRPDIT